MDLAIIIQGSRSRFLTLGNNEEQVSGISAESRFRCHQAGIHAFRVNCAIYGPCLSRGTAKNRFSLVISFFGRTETRPRASDEGRTRMMIVAVTPLVKRIDPTLHNSAIPRPRAR